MTAGKVRTVGIADLSISHVGYVVTDIRKAIDLSIRVFGAGPFFMEENVVLEGAMQGDRPLTFEHTNAFGAWGNLGLEFWQVDKMEPESAFGPRFAPDNALNHVAYYVKDVIAESDRLRREGFPLIMRWGSSETEARLHDAPEFGHMIELLTESAEVDRFDKAIKGAADNWDGRNPIRSFREVEYL